MSCGQSILRPCAKKRVRVCTWALPCLPCTVSRCCCFSACLILLTARPALCRSCRLLQVLCWPCAAEQCSSPTVAQGWQARAAYPPAPRTWKIKLWRQRCRLWREGELHVAGVQQEVVADEEAQGLQQVAVLRADVLGQQLLQQRWGPWLRLQHQPPMRSGPHPVPADMCAIGQEGQQQRASCMGLLAGPAAAAGPTTSNGAARTACLGWCLPAPRGPRPPRPSPLRPLRTVHGSLHLAQLLPASQQQCVAASHVQPCAARHACAPWNLL